MWPFKDDTELLDFAKSKSEPDFKRFTLKPFPGGFPTAYHPEGKLGSRTSQRQIMPWGSLEKTTFYETLAILKPHSFIFLQSREKIRRVLFFFLILGNVHKVISTPQNEVIISTIWNLLHNTCYFCLFGGITSGVPRVNRRSQCLRPS